MDVIGQGRTDREVHALAQTAHLDLPEGVNPKDLLRSVNQLLPKDINLLAMEPVAGDFHARFDAISRKYEYHITLHPDVLRRHTTVHVPWLTTQHVELMRQFPPVLLGEHDFSRFSKPSEEYQTGICTIMNAEWKIKDSDIVFTIEGNRFLRHLVRRLVGTMLDIVKSESDPKNAASLLQSLLEEPKTAPENNKIAIRTAPAHALVLVDVRYP